MHKYYSIWSGTRIMEEKFEDLRSDIYPTNLNMN